MPKTKPTTTSKTWTKTRSQIAVAIWKNPDADVTELRRLLKAQRLALAVSEAVASWPPLTSEQREEIALLLLRGSSE